MSVTSRMWPTLMPFGYVIFAEVCTLPRDSKRVVGTPPDGLNRFHFSFYQWGLVDG